MQKKNQILNRNIYYNNRQSSLNRFAIAGWSISDDISEEVVNAHLQIVNLTTMPFKECKAAWEKENLAVFSSNLCTFNNCGKNASNVS